MAMQTRRRIKPEPIDLDHPDMWPVGGPEDLEYLGRGPCPECFPDSSPVE